MCNDPRRIKRERTRGWRMPDGAVYVGRPSIYGNPYKVGAKGVPNARHAVWLFEQALERGYAIVNYRVVKVPTMEQIKALRDKVLVCWCDLDQPCHADLYLDLANK